MNSIQSSQVSKKMQQMAFIALFLLALGFLVSPFASLFYFFHALSRNSLSFIVLSAGNLRFNDVSSLKSMSPRSTQIPNLLEIAWTYSLGMTE